MNPHKVTEDFESELCHYTGAPLCVATTSCTMALLLALAWFKAKHGSMEISLPRYTYIGVGMSVLNAGHTVAFRDETWSGEYRLDPLPLWDSARRMKVGMFRPDEMQCLSFHWTKHLSVSQAGAIILDDEEAADWMRRARFDGRRAGTAPKDDTFDMVGYHAYLSPSVSAEGLTRLATLPNDNADLPWNDYSDLSTAPIFKRRNVA